MCTPVAVTGTVVAMRTVATRAADVIGAGRPDFTAAMAVRPVALTAVTRATVSMNAGTLGAITANAISVDPLWARACFRRRISVALHRGPAFATSSTAPLIGAGLLRAISIGVMRVPAIRTPGLGATTRKFWADCRQLRAIAAGALGAAFAGRSRTRLATMISTTVAAIAVTAALGTRTTVGRSPRSAAAAACTMTAGTAPAKSGTFIAFGRIAFSARLDRRNESCVVAAIFARDLQPCQPLDIAQVATLLVVDERDRNAFRSGTCCAADAVNIALRNVGNFVIDDV